MKLLTIILFVFTYIFAGQTVVPNDSDYYKHKRNNVELIYTKKNINFAQDVNNIETALHKDYSDLFDWKLDETLYVGLISEQNQIPNAFSTQYPNNRQINFIGGALDVDYFCSKSWLKTLIYHESAHNYQLNVKASSISQYLHSIFGNGSVFFPYFIVPNILQNSFMLEGNAVLNESLHGNGGRLYSGRFLIETILQAKAGNIKAGEVYNQKLAFPYGDIHYILGGFYNLYLAQKYGIKRVNRYFKNFSKDFYWPQYTNNSMYQSIGVDFEDSLKEFSDAYAKMADNVTLAKGKKIASTQFFSPLSNDNDEIFFITNKSGVTSPKLVLFDKKTGNTKKITASYIQGKVIKQQDKYFTQASAATSPTKIQAGLFDADGFVKRGTASKVVQGYLNDGRAVYFDVASSFSEPQLYVGDKFYGVVNSSVFIDKNDDLYYFKQNNKTRILYKNHKAIYAYDGYYGIVSGVDTKGAVYYVANSEFGSTLFKYKNRRVTRVSKADNIIEARLVNDGEVLLAAISDKDYYFVVNKLYNINQTPFDTKLFFEDALLKKSQKEMISKLDFSKPYNSLLDIHYSGTDFSFSSSGDNYSGYISANFADPLTQNSASIFVSKDEQDISLAGINYINELYLLNYFVQVYGVFEDKNKYDREYGIVVGAGLPFYKKGSELVSIDASYYQDYQYLSREPLSLSLSFSKYEQFGVSMYPNYINALKIYGAIDRKDPLYGAKYDLSKELGDEFYLSFGAKYSATTTNIKTLNEYYKQRGVKISNTAIDADMDPTKIYMPNIDTNAFVKDIGYAEVKLSKVINLSSYWFTFPLSLQRESIYTKYRRYELTAFSTKKYSANEQTLGLTLSSVIINKLTLPLSFEYIHNDAYFVENKDKYMFIVNTTF